VELAAIWPSACSTAAVASDIDASPDLEPDNAHNGVHKSDDDATVRFIPKPDRRKQRLRTPDCPRCGWDELVAIVARGNRTLTWRCSRCAWSWTQPVPAS
jgi:hypothetical protein